MASSSSSVPSSISQSWNHEVFLSFRGEDTRKNFVDHLYTALVQKGIQTYKDDETLARGESIGPSLRTAIQESRIAIVVFSQNYADSSWCLDELANIIECRDKRGQIVMPVFYDVDPSDVRKQNRKYGEAFVKHECENKDKVETWRKALVNTGNLSGWVLKDFANGHEAKCIEDIVGEVSGRLSRLLTNVNKDLIGIEARLLDLKSNLKIGSGGKRMVGIWGVGGGGKTTLASAVYMGISHQFEAHCFLENIRDESSKHGLKGLQEKLLSFLLMKKDVVVESEIVGRSMIGKRLCHKSVLVVLDDVDDLKQLEALAGSHDWFGEGSRIIITTRNKHLLSRKVDEVYEVRLLSQDEAIKLFRRHAYQENKLVEDYERLSLDIVEYAGGLPLALEVLGSFLCDKDKDEWKSALAKLKDIPNTEVTERLKISYDGLEQDAQELFLDLACFMRGWKRDDAMIVLKACSFYPVIGLKVLVERSLIKVSNGTIEMHDLIEEMARYIVKGKSPNQLEKHTRIWQEKDVVELCAMRAETLSENNHTEMLTLSTDVIQHPNLPNLPDVVASMTKLRWLNLRSYPPGSFAANFQPTKLGCLMLTYSNQEQLWQGCKVLPNLKILDLRKSYHLLRTPDFNGLPCLERLILKKCKNLKEIHPSIGLHERLVFVNMKGCKKLNTFPPIKRMKNLETLDLSSCRRLRKFPDIEANMDSLVTLDLEATRIEVIPLSVGQFCTNLVSFDLSNCEKLKRIVGDFRSLKRLKDLRLYGCIKLEKLAREFFDAESCLEVFSLSIEVLTIFEILRDRYKFREENSVRLKFPQFPRFLRKLELCWCDLEDGDIPRDVSELLNLQVLNLQGNDFSRLHFSLSQIPCLKLLNLSSCNYLVELPDLPSTIAILNVSHCESLERVGDLSNYKWLWKVSLDGCNKLIGDAKGQLHSILEVNAVEDRFMSVSLPGGIFDFIPKPYKRTLTLQLPDNWYSHFNGFLFSSDHYHKETFTVIVLNREMSSTISQPDDDEWEEFDINHESYRNALKGYVPFASLRHTSWWNSAYTNISFEIRGIGNFKVELVPTKSKSDRDHRSECWEEQEGKDNKRKAFKIIDDSSSIQIEWYHHWVDAFYDSNGRTHPKRLVLREMEPFGL